MNLEPVTADSTVEARGGSEVTVAHTRILRTMLAADDCYAYWQKVDVSIPPGERARVAFERRWFGLKSEARVRTLMGDMLERFDAFPEALSLLRALGAVSTSMRRWICHVHTQLADPIYRRFTGELLPERRAYGQVTIDREIVARWVDGQYPGRWQSSTALKFGANLLATAFEAGLVAERRDPRRLTTSTAPDVLVGYLVYLLRNVRFEGTLTDNPYLRSLGVTPDVFPHVAIRIPGIRFNELAGVAELTFTEPSLVEWGLRALRSTE